MKKFLILFLLLAPIVHAATIYPLPNEEGFFAKIWRCKWHISCYQQKFGATITTIASTDLIKDSRAVINTNFANLNSEVLGVLTPARLTATSTSASSSIAWGLEIYQRALAIGTTASTTIRSTATSSFNGGISSTASLDVQSTTATSTFANGISLARGCILTPASTCLSALDLSAENIWTGATTTFTNGVSIRNATSTNATTTSLQVSGLASTSQAIIGAFGVGIATTTQRNVQIAGDVQISGALSVVGSTSGAGTQLLASGLGGNSTGQNDNYLTTTIPANSLGTANVLEITAMVAATSTATNVKFSLGGVLGTQPLPTTTATAWGAEPGNIGGNFAMSILANGATNAQYASAVMNIATSTLARKALTVDSTAAQSLTISGNIDTGGSNVFEIRNILVKLFKIQR